ncbi:hypothetical protein ACFW0V_12490 [Micromonospora parva]
MTATTDASPASISALAYPLSKVVGLRRRVLPCRRSPSGVR